jgi:two-component system alkaline phosphatase synthesis response regulator PhoP
MKKILIVEDETFLIEMYKTKFEIENFQVISAISSEQAIKILKNDIPDLILLDILLPRKSGITFLKEVKEIREVSEIPVIVFSNYDDSKTREEAKQLGVEDYLIKTEFTPKQLLTKIKRYFKSHIK